MKSILLIGLGRFGRHAAIKLFELGHQIMAIDKAEENVQAVLPYVANAQIGDSTDEDFMESLGVSNYDLCFVAIGDDFLAALETTSLLKDLGAKFVVARASRDRHEKFLLRNGADEVVYPERQLAAWAAIRYSADHILDYVEVGSGYGIFEIEVPKEWLDKTVLQLDIRRKYQVNIMAIRRGENLNMQITPDTLFVAGDSVLVLGKLKEVQKNFRL